MIKKSSDLRNEVREHMRDGDGSVLITHLVEKENLYDKSRLFGVIHLDKNCSIGYHVHENDSEIFYVIKGEAIYSDNGVEKSVKSGDVLVCAKGEGHSIKNIKDEQVELVALIVYA
ncbi:MAG: cupin domain-containing protein [Bacillota bacterium]|nr:cupin domain-containing protein [Bacillota bacterium]